MTLLSLSFGWTLALAAALLIPLAARLLLVTPVIVLLASGPVTRLADGSSQVNPPSAAELWLRAAQLVILGALAVFGAIGARPRACSGMGGVHAGSFVHNLWPIAALMAGYTMAELATVIGYSSLAESGRTAAAIAAQANYTQSQHIVVGCLVLRIDHVADALRGPFYNGMLLRHITGNGPDSPRSLGGGCMALSPCRLLPPMGE